MALALRNGVVLEKAEPEGYVLLYDREPSHRPAPVFRLHSIHALVLALFDGTRSIDDLTSIIAASFDRRPEQARRIVDNVCRRYRQFLAERNGDGRVDPFNPADFVFPTCYDFRGIREAAPRALLWVVTECCTKRCRYCYKDARFVEPGGATDLGLSGARVVELIDEAAEIGVNTIVLTGGEPFLRPDLIELIGVMVDRGMEVIPITKERITGQRMRALARSGLQALHVSLDSHRPEVVEYLTGVPGAFEQMIDTLRAAADNGLPVVLRPVLTSYNARDFEGLVALANELQAGKILLDFYGASCGRHDEVFRVSTDDERWVREVRVALAERFPGTITEIKADGSDAAVGTAGRGCVEGSRGMTILPDGTVTKCEHWRFSDALTYGDLGTQSIMEVWESARLAEINRAPRQAYAGTICGRCRKLAECNERRGRCSLSAMLEYHTPHAPDIYCPIGAFQKRSGHHAASA